MVQMYTPPAVWPCSAEVNRNFVNHFSGNRFCDNMGLREQGSSPSCMSKDRTLTQVQSAKREKMRWIQPSSFKMKTYPRASHTFPFPAREDLFSEEIFPNPSHANSSYGWLDCIKLIGEIRLRNLLTLTISTIKPYLNQVPIQHLKSLMKKQKCSMTMFYISYYI